jgi:serine/threonine protein kinase/Leucine-rich repeat (LRR) protein
MTNEPTGQLSDEAWANLERIVEHFERAWNQGQRPAIDDFLPADFAQRRLLLPELIHAELELRLKAGEPVGVETYLERFPDLAGDRSFVLDLITVEYQQRRRREPHLALDEFRQRFPDHAQELDALRRVDDRDQGTWTNELGVTGYASGPSSVPATAAPVISVADFITALRRHSVLEPAQLQELARKLQARYADPKALGKELLQRGWLTPFQIHQLVQGRGQELILGQYLLLDRLGEGGMGQVFKARHRTLGRVVALKLIRKERVTSRDAVQRFQREIRAAAQLSHPNIVHAFDADEVGGTHFLVMEYVEGTNLAALVKELGPLPIAKACDYIRQAALGLQHAHERGLVHRDIKPANLLVASDNTLARNLSPCSSPTPPSLPQLVGEGTGGGEGWEGGVALPSRLQGTAGSGAGGEVIKILDLGLARLTQRAETTDVSGTMTQEGTVMGTPDYIAPEQARESHSADHRADLYSLGCTFYHLLTGHVPFPGGTLTQKLLKHQLEEPTPVEQVRPDLPPPVVDIVSKLLAKRPEDRYQSAAELAANLAPYTGINLPTHPSGRRPPAGEETLPSVPSSSETAAHWSSIMRPTSTGGVPDSPRRQRQAEEQRRWLVFNLTGAALIMVGLVVVLYLLLRESGSNQSQVTKEEPSAVSIQITNTINSKNPVDDAWIKSVAALPVEKQVEAVAKKLQELNPSFDGKVASKIENAVVTELRFLTDDVTDISPVRGLSGLKRLECFGDDPNKRKLSDLWPLRGMALTSLLCFRSKVADLSSLTGMPLTSLDLQETQVSDLSPLKGMPLNFLSCSSSMVKDLSPLKGMALTSLYCRGTKVSDLSPLKRMPLMVLDCNFTQVSDLSPLKGMPLTNVGCGGTRVSDLSPFKGMQLQELHVWGTAISDLSPLKGMHLTSLMCHGTMVTDLSPLKGLPLKGLVCDFKAYRDTEMLRSIKTLERINDKPAAEFWKEVDAKQAAFDTWAKQVAGLPPDKQVEAVAAKLKEFNPGFDGKVTHKIDNGVVTEVQFLTDNVTDVSPVRALSKMTSLVCSGSEPQNGRLSDLSPLRGLALEKLDCSRTQVDDLSALRGMPLRYLDCYITRLTDLSPLQGMPLWWLNCHATGVHDLSPLRGMKLTGLLCFMTSVSDLSPLKSLPLERLDVGEPVTDLSPLKGMPLKEIDISRYDFKPERDAEILRSIKTLEKINRKPAVQFWKEIDSPAPRKPSAKIN